MKILVLFRFVKNLVLLIVHHVYATVKHVVLIHDAKRNVVKYAHRVKRFVYEIEKFIDLLRFNNRLV